MVGRRRSRTTAGALFGALLIAPAAFALPAAATSNAELVYVEETYGPGGDFSVGLYRSNVDGSGRQLLLSSDSASFYSPELSPDGSRIVVSSDLFDPDFGIVVLDRDGTNVRDITSTPPGFGDGDPTWTPDGSSLVFTRYSLTGAAHQMMSMSASGAGVLSLGQAGYDGDVRADGRVVFTDTSGQLSTFPLTGGAATALPYSGDEASWSPDGTQVAFIDDLSRLTTVGADGGGYRSLQAANAEGAVLESPAWLPDGESLIYSRLFDDGQAFFAQALYTVDRLGQRAGALFGFPGFDVFQFQGQPQGPAATSVTGAGPASRFVPVEPVRAYDSRVGEPPLTGRKARLGPGQSVEVTLPGVPTGATAAVLNVTVVQPSTFTYVTAYPSGTPVPNASSVNVPTGEVIPNNVTVKLGTDGQVSLFNAAGTTDVIVDVAGFYTPTATAGPTSTGFTSQNPTRVYDSRPEEAPAGLKGQLSPGGFVDVPLAGPGLAVPTEATAVVLNITGINASTATLLRAYPTPASGDAVPTISNLNLPPGTISANLAVVKTGDGGRIRLRNDLGTVDAILDVAGYYSPDAPGQFIPVDPTRFLDTRDGTGSAPLSLGAQQSLDLRITGYRGIPQNATAVAANLTAVVPTTTTLLRAYPAADGGAFPTVSNLNLTTGQIRANAAYLVPDPTNGRVRLRNDNGNVHTLTDIAGYFTNTP